MRWLALAVVITQAAISITGSVVRVTGSGLGCPTWPQCFPGSMVPIEHPEISTLHQIIEFGNRTLTGVVGFIALACFLAAWRARPYRPRLVRLALIMPIGVAVQAIIGGITVRLDLLWWSVSLHFMASAVLIWLATLLFVAAGEGDRPATWLVTPAMRKLLIALVPVTTAMLIAGTLVTAAGPHAGDADTPRLGLPIPALLQLHTLLVMAYVCMLAVFGVWFRTARPTKKLLRVYGAACLVVLMQGAGGALQYAWEVPEAMVVVHVTGATLVIISNALLWGAARHRGPVPTAAAETPAETPVRT